jgi:hypothetical protein
LDRFFFVKIDDGVVLMAVDLEELAKGEVTT